MVVCVWVVLGCREGVGAICSVDWDGNTPRCSSSELEDELVMFNRVDVVELQLGLARRISERTNMTQGRNQMLLPHSKWHLLFLTDASPSLLARLCSPTLA
jgi:hypothetical protein